MQAVCAGRLQKTPMVRSAGNQTGSRAGDRAQQAVSNVSTGLAARAMWRLASGSGSPLTGYLP